MRLRPKRGAKSVEYKSGGMSIKSKRASKKIKRTGMQYMRIDPTGT